MLIILGFLWLMFMGVVFLAFVAWLLKTWHEARKYRELKKLHDTIPPEMMKMGPFWSVSYKEGRKVKQVVLVGKTEGEVVREFIRRHHGYDTITELVKL